jgi:hypothetical protein
MFYVKQSRPVTGTIRGRMMDATAPGGFRDMTPDEIQRANVLLRREGAGFQVSLDVPLRPGDR